MILVYGTPSTPGMVHFMLHLSHNHHDLSYAATVGTKNVAKKMKKITQGAQRSEGVTWFRQFWQA